MTLVRPTTETDALARLPGGELRYVLRRSPRSRRLRVTIVPDRGVVVSIPIAGRRGWARPEPIVTAFLAEREAWIRRHLETHEASRARLEARPSLEDGRTVPFLGVPHRVRVVESASRARASRVSRVGGDEGDELLIERARRDRRPASAILEAWFRTRARAALDGAIARHGPALRVTPASITIRDTTSRWGSCSRAGNLSFSWRLVLAPPEALDAVAAHELCHLRVFGHGPRFVALLASRVPDHAAWRRWLRRHSAALHAAID
jgi:predicted metal-dependent hydrolase